ncbi:MAG: rhodanese-like domain-containing protein [Pseudomonadota bacterium]
MNRRYFLIGSTAVASAAAVTVFWPAADATDGTRVIAADAAHAQAAAGEIWIIDIRRPDEWARTGTPEGAIPLDMRRDDFLQALATATAADPDRPVALICARGVRSHRLTQRLQDAGIAPVLDISEGMLGSSAGPGWLDRGLPTDQVES